MRGLNNRHGPDTVKTDTVRTWPGECEDTVRTLSIVGSDRARIKSRVGQFGLPFVKYPQSDADACYNLESNSELV